MEGINGPDFKPLSQDQIDALYRTVSNENVSDYTIKTLRTLFDQIRKEIDNLERPNETIAAHVSRFERCIETIRDGLKPGSPLHNEIDLLEDEVEALVDDRYGEGGLERPTWEDPTRDFS